MPRKHPPRLLPDAETRLLWRQAAGHLGVAEQTYVTRWLRFWTRALEELQDREIWVDTDVRLLAEFVEFNRQADFHLRNANANPYRTHTDSGRVFAHPGFALSRDARVQARVVADRLGLSAPEEDEADEGAGEHAPPPVDD